MAWRGPGHMLRHAYPCGTGHAAMQNRAMSELGPSPLAANDEKLSVAEAREAIARRLRPIDDSETVPLLQALGRVLTADTISPIDVPAHDNSAMDGYAF